MCTVKKELPADRAERRKRNKNGADMPVEYYTTKTGVQRVRTLHPTKGWRDRNVIWASRGINFGRAAQADLVEVKHTLRQLVCVKG